MKTFKLLLLAVGLVAGMTGVIEGMQEQGETSTTLSEDSLRQEKSMQFFQEIIEAAVFDFQGELDVFENFIVSLNLKNRTMLISPKERLEYENHRRALNLAYEQLGMNIETISRDIDEEQGSNGINRQQRVYLLGMIVDCVNDVSDKQTAIVTEAKNFMAACESRFGNKINKRESITTTD